MKKERSEPTIVEKAIHTVSGFAKVLKTIEQQVALRDQSKSTLNIFIRRIASICLYFGKPPEHILSSPGQQCLGKALFSMISKRKF